MKSKAATKIMQ